MTRALAVLLLAGAPLAGAAAQGTEPEAPAAGAAWTRSVARYGKWLTAGAAVTLTVLAAREHRSSQREWDALLALCRANSADCALGPDGRYLNATAELHYQYSLYFDRRARRRLLGAQLGVVASAVLFLSDRRERDDGPDNIPLGPLEMSLEPQGARVGFRVAF